MGRFCSGDGSGKVPSVNSSQSCLSKKVSGGECSFHRRRGRQKFFQENVRHAEGSEPEVSPQLLPCHEAQIQDRLSGVGGATGRGRDRGKDAAVRGNTGCEFGAIMLQHFRWLNNERRGVCVFIGWFNWILQMNYLVGSFPYLYFRQRFPVLPLHIDSPSPS